MPAAPMPKVFSPELQETVLRYTFRAAEKSESGSLNKAEFGILIRRAVPFLSSEDVAQIFADVDTSHTNCISYEELSAWLQTKAPDSVNSGSCRAVQSPKDVVHAAFRISDRNGDGSISLDAMSGVINKVCGDVSEDEVALLFAAM